MIRRDTIRREGGKTHRCIRSRLAPFHPGALGTLETIHAHPPLKAGPQTPQVAGTVCGVDWPIETYNG